MPNQQLTAGQFANGAMRGQDVNGNPAALSALSAAIDRYDLAYVAAVPSVGPSAYCVVQRGSLPTGVTTVKVTWAGKSADGTVLPDLVVSYDLDGATPPPQAVSIAIASEGVGGGTPPAPDPGSGSVILI